MVNVLCMYQGFGSVKKIVSLYIQLDSFYHICLPYSEILVVRRVIDKFAALGLTF